jgi:outer membrane protein OmpA-like peptidoglycan-associated protein
MTVTDTMAAVGKAFAAAVLMAFGGCANLSATLDATKDGLVSERSDAKGRVQQKLRIDNALAQAEAAEYQSMNPVPIMFDKMSIKLDDHGHYVLGLIVGRARNSSQLIVTGYCDRHQIGNASAAALARATAVRDELVHLGVPANVITLRHQTNAPGKHAADIEF